MKKNLKKFTLRIFGISLITFGFLFLQIGQVYSKELRVVFIAYENPDQLTDDVKPVVKYLAQELQMKVKHFVASDYSAIVEALRNQTADMGFMGPLQYVLANDQAGAYPILGEVYNGKPFYHSRIFVRKDSGIKTIQQLRGKTIAFTDPISSSGYMYPLDIFKQAQLIRNRDQAEGFFKKIYFAGGDQQAISAVLNKFVDAAGVGEYAYQLLSPNVRAQVIPIAESKAIPSHCVVVRKDLDKDIVKKLQSALLALNQGENRKLLKNLYNVDGYVKVDQKTYEEVESMAKEFGFLKKNKNYESHASGY